MSLRTVWVGITTPGPWQKTHCPTHLPMLGRLACMQLPNDFYAILEFGLRLKDCSVWHLLSN